MEAVFREENIVVLDFPSNEWLPNFFGIERAEARVHGLLINAEKGVWQLERKKAFIGKELWRYENCFLGQLVGVYDPTEKLFDIRVHELIRDRTEMFFNRVNF